MSFIKFVKRAVSSNSIMAKDKLKIDLIYMAKGKLKIDLSYECTYKYGHNIVNL